MISQARTQRITNQPKPGSTLFLLCMLALLLPACRIARDNSVRLGVPYRSQAPGSFDCGPASVLMWRLYDGLPEISQQTIGNWMGGTSCGVTQQALADAVNHFTLTRDAFYDLAADIDFREFLSRQITSIDNEIPVIAVIYGGLHAGVVNGGAWHDNSAGQHQWDYVYFHDPDVGANDYYTGDSWKDVSCPSGATCQQIISLSGSGGWSDNLNIHGGSVVLGGGGGGIEYQHASVGTHRLHSPESHRFAQ